MESAASARRGPKPGTIIAGKYRVDRVLGAGGMGVVFAAEHTLLKQRVALKFIADAEPDKVERLLREARAAASLESPHVCRVIDLGTTEDGSPFIAMEMLQGNDLASRLAAFGRRPIDEAVDWVLQALDAVAEAHARGIIHRDLKPSNIFLATRNDGSSIVKVLDFGISKMREPDETTADTLEPGDRPPVKPRELTLSGVAMGSPPYMSPEQITSTKHVDARSDIWSIGAVLYELLTGVRAFPGVIPRVADILDGKLVAPRQHRDDIPEALAAIVSRCLMPAPEDRFSSARALADALAPFGPASAATLPPDDAATTETAPTLSPFTRRRRRARVVVGALLVVALAAGAALRLHASRPASVEPEAPPAVAAPGAEPAPAPTVLGASPTESAAPTPTASARRARPRVPRAKPSSSGAPASSADDLDLGRL